MFNPNVRNIASRWPALDGLGGLREGDIRAITILEMPLIICRSKGTHFAFLNSCPVCEERFEDGILEGDHLLCGVGHGFEPRSSECSSDEANKRLKEFSLMAENGRFKISLAQEGTEDV